MGKAGRAGETGTAEVLTLAEDRERWEAVVAESPDTDVYFTAGYYGTFEAYEDAGARMFVYEEGGDRACFPFFLRRIGEEDLFDATTAYGYGGFLVPERRRDDASYAEGLTAALDDYYLRAGVVSEFVRFHPVLRTQTFAPVETHFVQPTIAVDTTAGPGEIWERYSGSQRRAVRKARQAELAFEIRSGASAAPGWLSEFSDLYLRTMRRVGAAEWYLFPETLLEEHARQMGGHVLQVSVHADSGMVAGALLLSWNGHLHYHLGASEADALHLRPNNWLFHRVIEWAHENGYASFHLGGGVHGEDSLYRFKRGLDPTGRCEFHVGRRIIQPEVYRELADAWREAVPEEATFDPDYFPLYRAKVEHD